jgi:hypothetical protein
MTELHSKHRFIIREPAKEMPRNILPDGAITGNGDLTVTLGGTADRVRLYIAKADFWKADGRIYTEHRGGISPLATAEILLPHLVFADYEAVQDMDNARIGLNLTDGRMSAKLSVTVCAGENTILLELDRSYPGISASVAVAPREGCEATCETGTDGGVSYAIRGFDTPECRFPTYGICALRRISETISDGRIKTLWAITVRTNHDTAAYRLQAMDYVRALDEADCQKLLAEHAAWWKGFWAKSGVSLPDQTLETYWYAGLYTLACCARNKKFPPGLWGGYITSDGMGWHGDYHLNYNYQGPFYALASCNHPELLECYSSPLNDYLPTARRYAKEFLGVRGCYFPVGIGPMGMETDYRPDTKEHGHLFLGQKSNGSYGAVVPMLHWYATRDKDFAKREYYDFLLSVADFWEDYLVFEDGVYHSYNDALHEVAWYVGPDYVPGKPEGLDDKDPLLSMCLIRMLMGMLIDISQELGENTHRIPKWKHILEHVAERGTFEQDGVTYLACKDGGNYLDELVLECTYPMGQFGQYITPELYEVARNTHRKLAIWDSHNRFCSYYPAAARLGFPADEIIGHIHEVIANRSLPNGMFRYGGGGIENSSAIPSTVNEMLLQSYEGVLRLFPVWDRDRDASFHGLRAHGAFLVDAKVQNGAITAEILSEQGRTLTIEAPAAGYTLVTGVGRRIPLTQQFTTVETTAGERLTVIAE